KNITCCYFNAELRKLNLVYKLLVGFFDLIAFYFCAHFLKYIFVDRLFFLFFNLLFQLSVLFFRNGFNFCYYRSCFDFFFICIWVKRNSVFIYVFFFLFSLLLRK